MKGLCELKKKKILLQAEPTNQFLNRYIDYTNGSCVRATLRGPSVLLQSPGQPAAPHSPGPVRVAPWGPWGRWLDLRVQTTFATKDKGSGMPVT